MSSLLNGQWTMHSVLMKKWILKEKTITQGKFGQRHGMMAIKRKLVSCVHWLYIHAVHQLGKLIFASMVAGGFCGCSSLCMAGPIGVCCLSHILQTSHFHNILLFSNPTTWPRNSFSIPQVGTLCLLIMKSPFAIKFLLCHLFPR